MLVSPNIAGSSTTYCPRTSQERKVCSPMHPSFQRLWHKQPSLINDNGVSINMMRLWARKQEHKNNNNKKNISLVCPPYNNHKP